MTDIIVTIDGRELTLLPSVHAAKKLSEKFGGLLPLMDVINLGNLAAATDVLFYALHKQDSQRVELEQRVYDAGLKYLAPHLCRYVISLMNGGKVVVPAVPNV